MLPSNVSQVLPSCRPDPGQEGAGDVGGVNKGWERGRKVGAGGRQL